jgi:hypothetical protein
MFLPNNIWDEVYGGRQVPCLKWMNNPCEFRTLGPAVTFQSLFIFFTYTIHFCGILVYAISTTSIITISVNAKVKNTVFMVSMTTAPIVKLVFFKLIKFVHLYITNMCKKLKTSNM